MVCNAVTIALYVTISPLRIFCDITLELLADTVHMGTNSIFLILLHSEWPILHTWSFDHCERTRVTYSQKLPQCCH